MRGVMTDANVVAEIKKMHRELGVTQREIASAYGVSESTVSRAIRGRSQKKPGAKHRERHAKCRSCGAPITNKGARFCWKCGTDVRTEEFKLAERLMAIFDGHYHMSDEHANAIRETCAFLGYDLDGSGLES